MMYDKAGDPQTIKVYMSTVRNMADEDLLRVCWRNLANSWTQACFNEMFGRIVGLPRERY